MLKIAGIRRLVIFLIDIFACFSLIFILSNRNSSKYKRMSAQTPFVLASKDRRKIGKNTKKNYLEFEKGTSEKTHKLMNGV